MLPAANPEMIARQDGESSSALASLAAIAVSHGLVVTPAGLRRFLGPGAQTESPLGILFAASQCGFDAVPLEGEFEHLSEVALPAIVAFPRGAFQPLFAVDADSALVGDVSTGEVRRVSRADFTSEWSGDVFQVVPDANRIASVRAAIARHSDWRFIGARLIGIAPLSGARLTFCAAVVLWLVALAFAPLVTLLAAACCLASLWIAAYPAGCAKCGGSAALAGVLPLPSIGAGFYAALAAVTLVAPPALVSAGLLLAAGMHFGLIAILLQRRIACYPCFLTGVLAIAAAALGAGRAGAEFLIVPAAAAVAIVVVSFAARLEGVEAQTRLLTLAKAVFAEPVRARPVRMIVYTRPDCPVCGYFKTILRPMLEDTFGASLAIEDRDASRLKLKVPIFFVSGASRIALANLDTEEMLERLTGAIQASLDPASASANLDGFHLSVDKAAINA